jgi:hypothetical protein
MPSNAGKLISTGIVLGIAHVLTGPDHISAIATLSANLSHREAFGLGIRWGVGHSTGLLVVGIILIVISDATQDTLVVPKALTTMFESLVGIFMILLGFYGVMRALQNRREGSTPEEDIPLDPEAPPTEETSLSPLDDGSGEELATIEIVEDTAQTLTLTDTKVDQYKYGRTTSRLELEHAHAHMHPLKYCESLSSKLSTSTMAILVGIIHGVAGPGGVLGVIPAVQIRDAKLSTLYLGTFCLASTVTMGCFASLYGVVSTLVGRRNGWEFRVECVSACMSILVGITWLILVGLGKLDDVFP